MTEETPCLGRLWRAGERNKGRVLQPPQVQHQGGKGGKKWEHVGTTQTEKREREKELGEFKFISVLTVFTFTTFVLIGLNSFRLINLILNM